MVAILCCMITVQYCHSYTQYVISNDDVFCRRITVPLCATNHLQNAIVVFTSLVDELKDIEECDLSDAKKMKLMEDSIMDSSKS